jgi:hypothetical protein
MAGWLWSTAAAKEQEPPAPLWWEEDEDDDTADGRSADPSADLGASLMKTAVEAVFDEKIFARVCRQAQRECEAAAADGRFHADLEFLRFEKGTQYTDAKYAGAVYAREFKRKFEKSGVTLKWYVTSMYTGENASSFGCGKSAAVRGLHFYFSFTGDLDEHLP